MDLESAQEVSQLLFVQFSTTGRYTKMMMTQGKLALSCRLQLAKSEDRRYSTFVRIGSGLSFADYVWIRDKPWKPWDPKHPPEFLQVSNRGTDDKGDIYLNPEELVDV